MSARYDFIFNRLEDTNRFFIWLGLFAVSQLWYFFRHYTQESVRKQEMQVLENSFKLDEAMDLAAIAASFGDEGSEEIEISGDVRLALDGYIRERASLYEESVTPLPAK